MNNLNHSQTLAARSLGVALLLASAGSALAGVRYVSVNSANPAPPYTNWITAATNIQDAVDAAVAGDEIVVSDGIYATGGRSTVGDSTTNRVAVDKSLTLRSVNGPQITVIDGGRATRCVYLTNGASLSGFTLTNGSASEGKPGGGVYCETAAVVSNCVITGNKAHTPPEGCSYGDAGGAFGGTLNNCTLIGNSAEKRGGGAYGSALNNCDLTQNISGSGGGAYGATLNNCQLRGNNAAAGGGARSSSLSNCTLISNSAAGYLRDFSPCAYTSGGYGGGVFDCTLNNCTLIGNAASLHNWRNEELPGWGGGAASSTLNNCIILFNYAITEPNYDLGSTLNYSCTTPLPTNGFGNIANPPLFVDTNGWSNLRLQPNSPCINAGLNALEPAGPDLDGNPRIVGYTVDIGAYEFQSPSSIISYAWLQQYDLPTDGSADYADQDGDGLNNWQEWRCGTDPTNALSALRLLAPGPVGSGLVVRWESVADRSYFLERSTTASSGFTPLATSIPGQPNTTSYTDTNAIGAGPWFYRVEVSSP